MAYALAIFIEDFDDGWPRFKEPASSYHQYEPHEINHQGCVGSSLPSEPVKHPASFPLHEGRWAWRPSCSGL